MVKRVVKQALLVIGAVCRSDASYNMLTICDIFIGRLQIHHRFTSDDRGELAQE